MTLDLFGKSTSSQESEVSHSLRNGRVGRIYPSLQAAGLARTSPLQEKDLDLPANGLVFGQRCTGSLASLDRTMQSWKTSQRCFIEGWATFSETWPRSGMMRNGTAYQLQPLVPIIAGTGCGLWHTPTARDWKGYTMRNGESICNQLRRIFGGTGVPDPKFIEELMGYPSQWTSLEPLETPSSPKSQP